MSENRYSVVPSANFDLRSRSVVDGVCQGRNCELLAVLVASQRASEGAGFILARFSGGNWIKGAKLICTGSKLLPPRLLHSEGCWHQSSPIRSARTSEARSGINHGGNRMPISTARYLPACYSGVDSVFSVCVDV